MNADGHQERRPPLRASKSSYEDVSEPCPAATKERRGLSTEERSDCCRRARAGAAQQYRAVGGGAPCPEEGSQLSAARNERSAMGHPERAPRTRPSRRTRSRAT